MSVSSLTAHWFAVQVMMMMMEEEDSPPKGEEGRGEGEWEVLADVILSLFLGGCYCSSSVNRLHCTDGAKLFLAAIKFQVIDRSIDRSITWLIDWFCVVISFHTFIWYSPAIPEADKKGDKVVPDDKVRGKETYGTQWCYCTTQQ